VALQVAHKQPGYFVALQVAHKQPGYFVALQITHKGTGANIRKKQSSDFVLYSLP
jgi:hypothetical protein